MGRRHIYPAYSLLRNAADRAAVRRYAGLTDYLPSNKAIPCYPLLSPRSVFGAPGSRGVYFAEECGYAAARKGKSGSPYGWRPDSGRSCRFGGSNPNRGPLNPSVIPSPAPRSLRRQVSTYLRPSTAPRIYILAEVRKSCKGKNKKVFQSGKSPNRRLSVTGSPPQRQHHSARGSPQHRLSMEPSM